MINQMIKKIENEKRFCKIVIGGDGAVGKTTICKRLTGELINEKDFNRLMTCGIEFHDLKLNNHHQVKATIWDLGGQDQFRILHEAFFRKVNIAIYVFSVEDFSTLIDIDFWIAFQNNEKPTKAYLIANKIDSMNRSVLTDEAKDFARDRNLNYFEISALGGDGFERFKEDLINTIKNYCEF